MILLEAPIETTDEVALIPKETMQDAGKGFRKTDFRKEQRRRKKSMPFMSYYFRFGRLPFGYTFVTRKLKTQDTVFPPL